MVNHYPVLAAVENDGLRWDCLHFVAFLEVEGNRGVHFGFEFETDILQLNANFHRLGFRIEDIINLVDFPFEDLVGKADRAHFRGHTQRHAGDVAFIYIRHHPYIGDLAYCEQALRIIRAELHSPVHIFVDDKAIDRRFYGVVGGFT
ncbi:hypothetical protein D3C87_1782490 [compost metagenome]